MGAESSSPSFNHSDDIVRVISAFITFVLGISMTILCLIMYRHNQQNKRPSYRKRYQTYINTICILGFSLLVPSLGKILPTIDIGEYKRSGDNEISQYGWWISYGVYTILTLFALSAYHKLTMFGIILTFIMSFSAGLSIVLLSLSSSLQGWILWSVTFAVTILFSHFFVWWKSKRFYTAKGKLSGTFLSEYIMDKLLLIVSMLFFFVLLLIIILGNEVTGVINEVVTEILYGVYLPLHWSFVSIITFFWYVERKYKEKEELDEWNEKQSKKNTKYTDFNWDNDAKGPKYVHEQNDPFIF